jgi:hypothetical protein
MVDFKNISLAFTEPFPVTLLGSRNLRFELTCCKPSLKIAQNIELEGKAIDYLGRVGGGL